MLPAIWHAIMFSRIITYYLDTDYISPSSVSASHSLSRVLCPLRLMKRSTLLQIMHFTCQSCLLDGAAVCVCVWGGGGGGGGLLFVGMQKSLGLYSGSNLKNIHSIKHRKTTHYPIYSMKLIILKTL